MTETQALFATPAENPDLEEGRILSPRFDADGLIAAIVQDAATGEVVMFAYMNAQALAATLETGFAHYWSRSRGKLWCKGETSGHRQKLVEMRTDCDQDALVLRVETEATGANCHTGRKSCFYRAVAREPSEGQWALKLMDDRILFDPARIYGART